MAAPSQPSPPLTAGVPPEVEPPSAPPRASDAPAWRTALSIGLALALIGFVLSRLDLAAFRRALAGTNHLAFAAFVVGFNFALLGADAVATTWLYRRTLAPVRVGEILVIRAASYLPALLNHHVGQGWLTYFVSRVYRASLARVAGVTLIVYATTFAAVVLVGVVAVPLAGGAVPWLAPVVGALVVAGVGYLGVLAWRPRWLAGRPALAPLFELGIGGQLLATATRIPHVLVQFAGVWVPLRLFGVDVPLGDALAYVPVVLLAVTLPLTPVGVGTRDVLCVELFAHHAAGPPEAQRAAVAAATLSWVTGLTLLQSVVSPLMLRLANRLLARATTAASPPGERAAPPP